MDRAISFIRDAHWLDGARVRGYALLLGVISLGLLGVSYTKASSGAGSDFLAFWGAARIVWGGQAAAVYDIATQTAVQGSTGFGEMFAFVNPPPFLFAITPLGALPYPAAWAVWVAVTYALWARASFAAFPPLTQRYWPVILAFPGALIAATHAQNGLLTGALLVGAVALIDRRPVLAGALIGALIIKPHLALLIPFWLAAGGRWKTFIAAAITAPALLALSWLVYGTDTMTAYMGSWDVSAQIMQIERADFYLRMATLYGQARVYFGHEAALIAYIALALGMLALVMASWKRFGGDARASGALALAATPLASPYLFNYDLAFLVFPVLWLVLDAQRRGFQPWDKLVLIALYLAPYATRAAAFPLGLNLMPLASAAMVWLIWRRGLIVREPLRQTERL